MSTLKQRWIKSASANIMGGVFTAFYGLALPAILSRNLNQIDFSIWNLTIQIYSYIQIFGAGLINAASRHIAVDNERYDVKGEGNSIGAALRISLIITGIAMLAATAITFLYPYIFLEVPREKVHDLGYCAALIGLSSALQLLSLVPAGIFLGKHKNIYWISSQTLSRILVILGVIILSIYQSSLNAYATWWAVANLMLVPISMLMLRIKFPDLKLTLLTTKEKIDEIGSYCKSLSVWSLSMLMVGGASVVIVGIYDLKYASAYTVASTLTNIATGILSAIMSPLLVSFSSLSSNNYEREHVQNLLSQISKKLFYILSFGLFFALVFGNIFLNVWVGKEYSEKAFPILIALSFSVAIRNLCLPYSILLLAVGDPRRGTVAVLVEGLTCVMLSAIFGSKYGSFGVALGAVTSSIIGVIYNIYAFYPSYNIVYNVEKYVKKEIVRPLIYFVMAFVIYLGMYVFNEIIKNTSA